MYIIHNILIHNALIHINEVQEISIVNKIPNVLIFMVVE